MPTTVQGMTGSTCQCLKITIIAVVKRSCPFLDTHYTRRQLTLRFLLQGFRSPRLCTTITAGENIQITIIIVPDSLVILRAMTSAGKTNFISAGNHRSLIKAITAVNGDECFIGMLCGRNLPGSIGSRTGTS